MKRINQFERTDRDITNAMLAVMEHKSFEKITVQDILEQADNHLSELEREILAGMLVRFMVYHLQHGTNLQEPGQLILKAWMNMSLYFFRVDNVPDAAARILDLIGQMHREK